MINVCCKCDHLLCEGDKVRVTVESTYHVLKSTVAYALDKFNMEADSTTLRHVKCPKKDK